jgi:uncharacterized Fe-S cluster protein YjdI
MIQVKWDDKICSHSGVCVKTLPQVFKVENGQFVIDPKAASEQHVRDTVDKCPSGALSIDE